jgi:hypothetical protein
MERTLISWNVPNMVTVPLMAFVGFLILAVIVQLGLKIKGSNSAGNEASTAGGY